MDDVMQVFAGLALAAKASDIVAEQLDGGSAAILHADELTELRVSLRGAQPLPVLTSPDVQGVVISNAARFHVLQVSD